MEGQLGKASAAAWAALDPRLQLPEKASAAAWAALHPRPQLPGQASAAAWAALDPRLQLPPKVAPHKAMALFTGFEAFTEN